MEPEKISQYRLKCTDFSIQTSLYKLQCTDLRLSVHTSVFHTATDHYKKPLRSSDLHSANVWLHIVTMELHKKCWGRSQEAFLVVLINTGVGYKH